MQDDERCCGTGTCIIDAQGHCWCGQQWDGTQMCRPSGDAAPASATEQADFLTRDHKAQTHATP
ncbi:MAG: hypothetical protein CFE44_12700 [Burkholderiales bacterium PBB4]|nr:MAG: hypothetical protein CFE44_12700 [Burkholderiales bacterium PBB4]